MSTPPSLLIKQFSALQHYEPTFAAMKQFTEQRDADEPDQLWLLQHYDVLTQGQAGKPEHILLSPPDLPIIQTDRGGQVTWHGKGQLVGYLMFDLNRLKWHVRDLVNFTEQLLIDLLATYNLEAYAKKDAPGVYINEQKIASLGFKIRKGCSYHGFALNIDCNLQGFSCINPCGFAGLQMIRLVDILENPPGFEQICQQIQHLIEKRYIFSSINTGLV
ncbi:lipoyl(octanoyl) transferase LipB [Alkanindiges sp. WGS2144]|uniref:lipoyl(octanoyl) transferase LipB n=1 Tax=Alkanindiges sp. WGS2144 TaxID=3366808 RepID=UPI0037501979